MWPSGYAESLVPWISSKLNKELLLRYGLLDMALLLVIWIWPRLIAEYYLDIAY